MYSYSVAVVDDEPEFRKRIVEMFTAYQSESSNQLIIYEFGNAEELLEVYKEKEHPFQILILDVEMGTINGAEAAKKIRKKDKTVSIIFVTNFPSYAIDAFEVDAIGYLVKPVEYIQLKSRMAKAIIDVDYLHDRLLASNRYLTVKMHFRDVPIEINGIYYIEKRRNQSVIHTENGEYTCYDPLKQLYESLDHPRFVYCHQGYIVNFERIKSINETQVCFSDHMVVPLSRKYYTDLKTRLINQINAEREKQLLDESMQFYQKKV